MKEITLKMTRDEIEIIIEWAGVVENEFHLSEHDEEIINKLHESLK